MKIQQLGLILVWSVLLVADRSCFAHFLWLVPQNQSGSEVHLYFSEGPEPDNPKLLQKLKDIRVDAFKAEEMPQSIEFAFTQDQNTLQALAPGATTWKLRHTYGVHGRGSKSLLVYSAASVTCGWPGFDEKDRVRLPKDGLDLHPTIDGKLLKLTLLNKGEVTKEVQIDFQSANDHQTLTTDSEGHINIDNVEPGVYAVRYLETAQTSGNYQNEDYVSVKHYTTISFIVPNLSEAKLISMGDDEIGELPEAITSFGATAIDNVIYAYGGHTGEAHSYSNEEQFNKLIRLDVNTSKKWETIGEGPKVQGNALVAAGSNVILVGGFTAENQQGETSRLVSQSGVQQFNLQNATWIDLPNLPEPRSSMDAAVLDEFLYVIGGWAMNGHSDETKWHKTAWRLPLTDTSKGWQPIASPPFERRALATAAHSGRLFVIGGMNAESGPTTETCVYDPSNDTWRTIGSIAGIPMNGFGAAATEVNGRLIVTTVDGSIQRLQDREEKWEIIGTIPVGRFFHRTLPVSKDSMAIIGGANMSVGKFRETEFIQFSN